MNKQKNLEQLCWNNFLETGEIGYYLLYNKIKKEDKNERRNNSKSNSDKKHKL